MFLKRFTDGGNRWTSQFSMQRKGLGSTQCLVCLCARLQPPLSAEDWGISNATKYSPERSERTIRVMQEGRNPSLSCGRRTEERKHIKALQRKNRRLRRVHEVLKLASGFLPERAPCRPSEPPAHTSSSNTAMLSTCAVCGNMLTTPAAVQR